MFVSSCKDDIKLFKRAKSFLLHWVFFWFIMGALAGSFHLLCWLLLQMAIIYTYGMCIYQLKSGLSWCKSRHTTGARVPNTTLLVKGII